jgi:hypothetical protein
MDPPHLISAAITYTCQGKSEIGAVVPPVILTSLFRNPVKKGKE